MGAKPSSQRQDTMTRRTLLAAGATAAGAALAGPAFHTPLSVAAPSTTRDAGPFTSSSAGVVNPRVG